MRNRIELLDRIDEINDELKWRSKMKPGDDDNERAIRNLCNELEKTEKLVRDFRSGKFCEEAYAHHKELPKRVPVMVTLPKVVSCWNVKTKETKDFSSISSAAAFLDVQYHTIRNYNNRHHGKPFLLKGFMVTVFKHNEKSA